MKVLTEAVVLCLIGGVVGIMEGRGSSFLVTTVLHWSTAPLPAIVAAAAVSAAVGINFALDCGENRRSGKLQFSQ